MVQNNIITYSLTSLLLICTTGCTATKETKSQTSSNKGKYTMLTPGSQLDLSTFQQGPDGILYQIIKPGNGLKAYRGESVEVHYIGCLHDGNGKVGKKFDSSVDRNSTFKFNLGIGQVIRGWDLMVADMSIGEKRIVILPSTVAYGTRGAGAVIPPNATLIFEIELFGAK